jgi:hypothetical protein
MTTRSTLVAAAALALFASPALAGPCADQIADIQKRVSAVDAGSGPIVSGSPGTTGSTAPNVPKAGEAPGTEATAANNALTRDRAASPADVRAQTQGQPTASEAASRGTGVNDRMLAVTNALDRARTADAANNSTDCTSAVNEARRLLDQR